MSTNTLEQNTAENKSVEIPKTTATAPIIEKEFELAVYDVTINESTGKEDYRKVSFPEPVTVTARSQRELEAKLNTFKECGQIAKVIRILGEKKIGEIPIQTPPQSKDNSNATTAMPQTVVQKPNIEIQKSKPRFFKVGDIEVKDDNGKIYQKQWMRLTDSEAANIRIINDKNNATVSLAGKHLELKKWVLVEDVNSEDSTSTIEDNIR